MGSSSRDSGVFNMTMNIPAQNPSEQHCFGCTGYGGCSSFGVMSRLEGYYGCSDTCLLGSSSSDHLVVVGPPPPLMAEDESRTESVNEAGSSCNYNYKELDHQNKDEGWLRLGIGSQSQPHHDYSSGTTATAAQNNNNKQQDQSSRRGGGGLVELDLLPGGSSSSEELRSLAPTTMMFRHDGPRPPLFSTITSCSPSTSLFVHQQYDPAAGSTIISSASNTSFPHHQEFNTWAFRPFPRNIVAASSPSSLLGPPAGSNYFARPFQLIHSGLAARPAGIDFRVIDPPPPRPHSGIWFMLQAAETQVKEPFLPQIPKSFLRTRDGRMTIRLVIKYLVNKLKLESESEVEIRCRGQQILPFLTLQHVRDSIWSPRDALVTLLPSHDSSSPSSSSSTTAADHVMVLHYGRSP